MTKKTRTGLYQGGVSLGVILGLLAAPFSPTPIFLEDPFPEHEICPLRGWGFKKGITRTQGLLGILLQVLKAFLILCILAWMLANTLSFKDILQATPFSPQHCPDASSSTSPSQPSNTPQTTPDWQHPFLKTIHQDPTVQRYRALFDLVDKIAPPENPHKRGPKKGENTDMVYLKAYLVKAREPIRFFTKLRQFLVEHPALVVFMGFALKGYTPQWGFDPEKTVVSAHQFSQKLRRAKQNQAKGLFNQTILSLKELEVLRGEVSCDTAEVWAPVKENNPKQFIPDRWNKQNIPEAAPTARLGTKPTNEKDPKTGKKKTRHYWGCAILIEIADVHNHRAVISLYRGNVGKLQGMVFLQLLIHSAAHIPCCTEDDNVHLLISSVCAFRPYRSFVTIMVGDSKKPAFGLQTPSPLPVA